MPGPQRLACFQRLESRLCPQYQAPPAWRAPLVPVVPIKKRKVTIVYGMLPKALYVDYLTYHYLQHSTCEVGIDIRPILQIRKQGDRLLCPRFHIQERATTIQLSQAHVLIYQVLLPVS